MQKPKPILAQALLASRKAFIYVGIFSFFVNILMLTVPIYMLQLFDRVLASHSYETLIYLTIIAVTALFVFALLDMTRSRILVRVSSWLDNFLSPAALSRSADEILQGRPYGAQSLRDINTIRQFLGGAPVFAFFDSPWVPVYLAVIYLMHPVLGAIATVGAIILFSLALTNELATRVPLSEANAIAISAQRQTDSAMRNAEVIQAMGMMPNIIRTWMTKNKDVLTLQALASNRAATILSLSKFFRLSLQLLILGVGAYFVVINQITPGVMIAASILMSRALAPVEQAIGAWKQMIGARSAYKRLREHFAQESIRTAGITLPKPKGLITFENVIYVPPGSQKPTLNNISMSVQAGEMIALIGPSAAGKSTIAKLMVGSWRAAAGSVRLDGADAYTWDRTDFGQYVGYLPQDVELFAGTIKENIARMGDVDDEAVIEAAQLTGVHDLVLHLPQGYDTEIHSGLFELSGGQRQRIALARALYKKPQVLILDEPNSNLDNDGEIALVNAVLTAQQWGATVIIVAHRPAIVRHVDRIFVITEGKIQFSGPRDEVLAKLQELAQGQQQKTDVIEPMPGGAEGEV